MARKRRQVIVYHFADGFDNPLEVQAVRCVRCGAGGFGSADELSRQGWSQQDVLVNDLLFNRYVWTCEMEDAVICGHCMQRGRLVIDRYHLAVYADPGAEVSPHAGLYRSLVDFCGNASTGPRLF